LLPAIKGSLHYNTVRSMLFVNTIGFYSGSHRICSHILWYSCSVCNAEGSGTCIYILAL